MQNGGRDRLLASRVSFLLASTNGLEDPRPFADRFSIGWRVRSDMCLNSDRKEAKRFD